VSLGSTSPTPTRASALAYIERASGDILCVWNRKALTWGLPGGKVEEGETLAAACQRELLEETGLEWLWGEHAYAAQHDDTLVHVFRCSATGDPRETEPGAPVSWMPRAKLLRASTWRDFYVDMFAAMPLQGGSIFGRVDLSSQSIMKQPLRIL